MNSASFGVRRATVEDLPRLTELWMIERLPVPVLKNRLTEFQVVTSPEGEIVAAVGLQVLDGEGQLHSEAISDAAAGDAYRGLMWSRLLSAAQNHGMIRLWTRLEAPFWREQGFQRVPPTAQETLPAGLGTEPGAWFMLRLREDAAALSAVDKQFAMLRELNREQTERTFRRARVMRTIAFVIVGIVLLIMGVWAYLMIFHRDMLRR